ncbi:sarcosine oxidase subunit alpha [Rhodoligotrophos appendicifer]|uniref:sarcosine oxidase subunit alpha family protein n=1 Tax=Rhodoligotrophos appendicifer TaxID=987056 RepID=UPI0011865E06|nr:sarcosine oxidase subunit alpha family protein [Rhodoligotrophos appendicifer]
MTGKPYRVALSPESGRLIDPTRRLSFTFDGQRMTGFAGDTLASAVLANGQRLFGRSFKYHRPRGLLGLGSDEPNALVGIGEGTRHEPNLRATQVELHDGLVAVSQNRWPDLRLDVGQLNQLASRILPAGFYYKTFMWPQSFWEKLYEPVIRRAAGLGRAPTGWDPDTYEHINVHCDVLVVGAGAAGLAAAEAAASRGAHVILADENPRLGGLADIGGGLIDGHAPIDWARQTAASLAAATNVHILTRTTVWGHFHDNFVGLFERLGDQNPGLTGTPRHRLWKVRARHVILATGALERPVPFANNDRPGIMLSTAARGLLHRYGVSPGSRGVVFTTNDDGYRTALALAKAGVPIARVLDARAEVDCELADLTREANIPVSRGMAVSNVATSFGGLGITGITAVGYRPGQGRVTSHEQIACDFVAVSGGWNPAVNLWSHNGGKLKYDEQLATYRPDAHSAAMCAVGAANGTFALPDILEEAYAAGEALSGAPRRHRPRAHQREISPAEPVWFVPATGKSNEGNKHFVDYQNDVTVADLELAVREGYQSIEHVKRYTTWGMATDQGKTSSVIGLGIVSGAIHKPVPQIGTTTYRPPYTPISFGAMAGSHAKHLFIPVRRTPINAWHVANNASFEPVGHWRRPYCYPRPGEDRHAAVNREILVVREKLGLIDASTLGKIEIKGPDAAAFLDRIYTNTFSTLKVGRARYGLMMNEAGFLFDDGVTVRLGPDHFLMHTTSGGADRVAAWLEEWLQTEWTQDKVYVTNVTEQWAQFAIAGAKARALLEKLGTDIDLSPEALPFMGYAMGTLAGTPIRLFRISFSGELSFEVATPAGFGRGLWDAILTAGQEFGIGPYGTEALHVLRAEKGFIAIGDETDGTVTPLDLGLDWAVSKKKPDFLGKRALELSYLKAPHRKQLVGLLTELPDEILPDGAYAVEQILPKPPMTMIGQVSSTYWSPTLKRSIALALIKDGRARMGTTLSFPVGGDKVIRAKVVEPIFFDKEGTRQNV